MKKGIDDVEQLSMHRRREVIHVFPVSVWTKPLMPPKRCLPELPPPPLPPPFRACP